MSNKPIELHDSDIFTFKQYSELDIPEETFLLEPWLILPSYTLLVAKRGLGKSFFSIAVASAIASGTDVMCWHAPEPQKVLYIDGEMSSRQLQDRLRQMTVGLPHIDENLLILSAPYMVKCEREAPRFAEKAWRAQLWRYIARNQDIKLIIFDNISCLFAGLDENNKSDWDEPDEFFIGLRSSGISVMLVHHKGKDGSKGQRGSSAREDHVDVTLNLTGVPGHDPSKGCKLTTHFDKSRSIHGEKIMSMQMDLEDVDGRLQFVEGEATELQKEIMAEIALGTSFRATAKKLDCNVRYVTTTVKRFKNTLL